MTESDGSKNEASGVQDDLAGERPPRKKRRRSVVIMRYAAVSAFVVVLLGAIGIGAGEYYTSQPEFCASCHNMEPYYDSWSHDLHGAKLGVKCVDCHYAPGEKFTVMAKFKGLSQAASYFSGRSGASRPRAHVSDASCKTSGCHGDEAYLTKPLLLGERRVEKRLIGGQEVEITRSPTVQFSHDVHLGVDDRLVETEVRMNELSGELELALPANAFARVRKVVSSVGPPDGREAELKRMLAESQKEDLAESALELMRLEHARTRLLQLSGLTCTTCHTYDASGTRHLTVDYQTCYTCHFTNEAFNRETAACLTCHEPPSRQIVVHDQKGAAPDSQAALMNHQAIVGRGIDCASCHLDVIRGQTRVTSRECTHCHDQDRYLEDFAARDTEIVAEYHRTHVAAQRARCVDCHTRVEHSLLDPGRVALNGGFLQPVLDDCKHCHPNHHQQQVHLLTGTGGMGAVHDMPNAMLGSRLNCRACHTEPGSDFKGAPLIEATERTCVTCHSDDYETLFQQWVDEIAKYIQEAEAALARVESRIEAIEAAGDQTPQHVAELVEQARHNLQLVRSGNGIHNKNYALQLLDISIRNLDEALMALPQP